MYVAHNELVPSKNIRLNSKRVKKKTAPVGTGAVVTTEAGRCSRGVFHEAQNYVSKEISPNHQDFSLVAY